MATYTSYDVVGVKEDISDIITNISPTQTPFITSLGNEKVTQQLFQWQTDVLRPVQSAAVGEGVDLSGTGITALTPITASPTHMLSNRTQIFVEAVVVSGTLEATSTYGRARESAYQLAKSAAALKRDLEYAMVGTGQAQAQGSDAVGNAAGFPATQVLGAVAPYGTGTAAARFMAGAQSLVAAPGIANDGGIVYYQNGTSTTEIAPLTEAANASGTGLLPALEQIYINGGNPNVIMVTPGNALTVAGWVAGQSTGTSVAARTRFLDNNDKGARKLINVIDIYVSPFGEQKIINDRFLHGAGLGFKGDHTIVYDPDMFSQMTLRPWTRETLAKTGDSLKMMILGEFSLKCKAPKACAVIVDNAVSGEALTANTLVI